MFELDDYLWKIPPVLVVFLGVLLVVPLLVYLERKLSAMIQDRSGPNRVSVFGPDGLLDNLIGMPLTKGRFLGGLFQPFADAVKLLAKEDMIPAHADKFLFTLAPLFALLVPLLTFVVIPVGAEFEWGARKIPMLVADLGVGLLWILSVASLSPYGVSLGGWASNNKFGLLGGVRATAQMISYEIGLGLVIISVAMQYSSLSLKEIVEAQAGSGFFGWGCFHQPLAFLMFVVCAFAENNRLPFDMPECEAELVGGFHTEYSSMKFGMFFQGEYIAMVSMGAITAALFLGGWHYPGYAALKEVSVNLAALLSLVAFAVKVLLFICFQIWVRWTLPRFRYDQMMGLGWKALIPVALANLMLTLLLNMGTK